MFAPPPRSRRLRMPSAKLDSSGRAAKVILDTCGGLGYFASWCLPMGQAAQVHSYEEESPDVILVCGGSIPGRPASRPGG